MTLLLMKKNFYNQNRLLTNYRMKILFSLLIIILIMTLGCKETIRTAPDFELSLYETKDYTNNQKYVFTSGNNKPAVINFWFPSCPPCINEMPDINSVYLEYKDVIDVIGVQLIGIDSVDNGKKFVKKNKFSYAIGPDSQGIISINYDVTLFPTTLFINQKGQIVESWQGSIKKSEILSIMNSILDTES